LEVAAVAQRLLDIVVVPVVVVKPVIIVVVVEGFCQPPAEQTADDGTTGEGRGVTPEAVLRFPIRDGWRCHRLGASDGHGGDGFHHRCRRALRRYRRLSDGRGLL
jgi:hypothetical protein